MDKMYEIKRATDNINWNDIPVFEMGYAYLATPEDITAFGQICVGKEDIFVHLWANQSQIRAEEYGILGLPYKDSCLEFFFRPEETDPRYFNFEFNFNKCLYLGIGIDLKTRQRILLEDLEGIFKPITKRTKQGWEILYRIPFSLLEDIFRRLIYMKGRFSGQTAIPVPTWQIFRTIVHGVE